MKPELEVSAESPLGCEMFDRVSRSCVPVGGTAGSRTRPATFLPLDAFSQSSLIDLQMDQYVVALVFPVQGEYEIPCARPCTIFARIATNNICACFIFCNAIESFSFEDAMRRVSVFNTLEWLK